MLRYAGRYALAQPGAGAVLVQHLMPQQRQVGIKADALAASGWIDK